MSRCAIMPRTSLSTARKSIAWHSSAVERTSQTKVVMPFQPVSMHSIRSSNQRALADALEHARQRSRLSSDRRSSIRRPRITAPSRLILWDVERTGEAGGTCFRVRRLGLRAAEAIGDSPALDRQDDGRAGPAGAARDFAERRTTNAPPAAARSTRSSPRSMRTDTRWTASGCCCRSATASSVEQIVASLQLISFQGAIERQEFCRDFERERN